MIGSMPARAILVGLCSALSGATSDERLDPRLFEPGRIGTDAVEVGLAFEPDGDTLYFTRHSGTWGGNLGPGVIHVARRSASGWSAPQPAPFSGEHDDGDVSVSPDGRRLFFTSVRPDEDGERDDADILMMVRSPDGRWSSPARLPEPVNSRAREMSPILSAAGRLYFVSDRKGGLGQGDIYVADFDGKAFSEPVNLGPAVNSRTGEWNLVVDPKERFLIFEAAQRTENKSVPGDLWISYRRGHHWSDAVPLATINTEGSDLAPALSPDGRTLYYTSTRERGATGADILHADLAALIARHPSRAATNDATLAVVSRAGISLRWSIPHEASSGRASRRAEDRTSWPSPRTAARSSPITASIPWSMPRIPRACASCPSRAAR